MLMADNKSPIGMWFLSLPFLCLYTDNLPAKEATITVQIDGKMYQSQLSDVFPLQIHFLLVRIAVADTLQSTTNVLAFSSYLFLVFSPLILLSKSQINLDY
ncbi:hypothetical protein T4E_12167 [Trichinella pseudospiralis]|uniref:Uncharacterized protein n=1 Tax=Trichinella pseudospiralis TaxID=6337 RepID=A0A0V0XGQ4_TRIPS|nr:hypothetical protein T4E_12167 [Trichinella pseudospiralis]